MYTLQPSHEAQNHNFNNLGHYNVFFAPASGPRGFSTMGFEDAFRRRHVELLQEEAETRWFVGGSTGALRFCALLASLNAPPVLPTNPDPNPTPNLAPFDFPSRASTPRTYHAPHGDENSGSPKAPPPISSLPSCSENLTQALVNHYCDMHYQHGDSPATLTPMMEAAIDLCRPEAALATIAASSHRLGLVILAGRYRAGLTHLPDAVLKVLLAGSALGHAVLLPSLHMLFARVAFYTGSAPPSFLLGTGMECYPLTHENIRAVLRASSSIPFISERVYSIPGTPPGSLYADAALCDYQLNIEIRDDKYRALLLADCLSRTNRVYRSVLDCFIPYQGAPRRFLKHTTVIRPNDAFLKMLQVPRLPRVHDWFHSEYIENPDKRKQVWRSVYELSCRTWPLK